MYTLQSPAIIAALNQAGMDPAMIASMTMIVSCSQTLENRAPVSVVGQLPSATWGTNPAQTPGGAGSSPGLGGGPATNAMFTASNYTNNAALLVNQNLNGPFALNVPAGLANFQNIVAKQIKAAAIFLPVPAVQEVLQSIPGYNTQQPQSLQNLYGNIQWALSPTGAWSCPKTYACLRAIGGYDGSKIQNLANNAGTLAWQTIAAQLNTLFGSPSDGSYVLTFASGVPSLTAYNPVISVQYNTSTHVLSYTTLDTVVHTIDTAVSC